MVLITIVCEIILQKIDSLSLLDTYTNTGFPTGAERA